MRKICVSIFKTQDLRIDIPQYPTNKAYRPHEMKSRLTATHPGERSNKPTFGVISKDLADYDFRTVLENIPIPPTLRPRPVPPNTDMLSSVAPILDPSMTAAIAPSLAIPRISDGQMPMLTRAGFTALTTIEFLSSPARAVLRVDRIVAYYALEAPWSGWGACPRWMVPEECPRELAERMERVAAFGRRQAEERVEAKRDEMAIRERGRQNLLDLWDPSGTSYHYRN